ncbi:hypothetical protein [Paraburkholderia sp. Cy-641]|uniref:hypothetical protein n=1 Tax=Paraburkholderia sp. Cy-641 TaxID=2608337 RepID=UPI001F04599A|nr:hypothetical protein [Paraburkholderia sp. Cy-641]
MRHAMRDLARKPVDADLGSQRERDEVAVRIVRAMLERIASCIVDALRNRVGHRHAQISGTAAAVHCPPHRHGAARDVAQ